MIRNKFQFQTISNVIQIDWDALKMSMREFPEGEIIVRKKISWDTDKMNRYFHGPVLDFLRAQFRDSGTIVSKEEAKIWVKGKFLGHEERNGFQFLKSTASLGRDEYIQFLKDIDGWCQEWFKCPIPESEHVD